MTSDGAISVATGDGGFQREIACEDGEATQHRALSFRKQLIAPVEGRAERLMTRQGGAPAARQNPKPIVEVSRQFSHAEDVDARRRQLERQRHAVEPAANLQNRRRSASSKMKPSAAAVARSLNSWTAEYS